MRAMAQDPHKKATVAHRRLIGQLRRSNQPGAVAVAAHLEACEPATPCRSLACPVCGVAFQEAMVTVGDRFIRTPAWAVRDRTHQLTIVSETGCVGLDELSAEVFERVGTEIAAALADLGLPPALISLEASFNEDTTGRLPPHWCAHTHGFGLDWVSAAQERSLKDRFRPSPWVRNPVRIDLLDQRIAAQRYHFKAERYRRVTVLKTDHPTRKPFRDTDYRPLRPDQAVRLALVEHELGFGKRLLIHGIEEEAVRRHLASLGWPRDGP